MKLTLSIKDRIVLPSIMPNMGSMSEIRYKNQIIAMALLSEDELVKVDIKEVDGKTTFNAIGNVDIELSEDQVQFLKLVVKHKSDDGQVHDDFFELFDKIEKL